MLGDEAGKVYFFSAVGHRVLEYETGVWGIVWGECGKGVRGRDVGREGCGELPRFVVWGDEAGKVYCYSAAGHRVP